MASLPPCIHYRESAKAQCELERDAPRDCANGCAAYEADAIAAMSLDPSERTRCEVWSRVMGYHRPVEQWNAGKQQEHRDRKKFREPT